MLKNIFSFYLTVGIPLIYLLNLFLIAFFPNTFMISNILISNIAKITGLMISFTGLILWISSMIELGSLFGVLPRKQKKIKTGIYRYLNHPMYIGISMTMLGISLANGSLQGLIFALMILVPILIIRSRMESRILY